jgi:hypothetical protein
MLCEQRGFSFSMPACDINGMETNRGSYVPKAYFI